MFVTKRGHERGRGRPVLTTHFLPAGAFSDILKDIRDRTQYLKHLLELTDGEREGLVARYASEGYYTTFHHEVEKTVLGLAKETDNLWRITDSFQSEPLLYTGEGTTEQIIALLTQLLDQHINDRRKISS